MLTSWCQTIRESAISTLSRNPKHRVETKIKISVSEWNVIVFPNMLTLDNFWIMITARMLSSTRPQDTFQSPTGTCFSTIHFSELPFISFSLQTKLWGESHVFSPAKPNVYLPPPFSSYLCSRSIFLLDFRLIIGVHLTKPAAIPLHCAWRAPSPCWWCQVPCREAAACLLCLRSLRVVVL